MAPDHKHLVGLPLSLVSPVDLGRLIREIDAIDNAMLELGLRSPGAEVKMPKTSHIMDELVGINKLNLLDASDRKTLKQFLTTVHDRAPRLHVSFSADPSPLFTEKLMTWLRAELHPVVLLTVGLQPNIGAGCVVRTTNKYFDLSLGKDFENKRDLLMKKLRAPAPTEKLAEAAPTPVEAAV